MPTGKPHPLLSKAAADYVSSWKLTPLKTEGSLRQMIATVFVFFDFHSMGGRHPPVIVVLEDNAFVVKEQFLDKNGLLEQFHR